MQAFNNKLYNGYSISQHRTNTHLYANLVLPYLKITLNWFRRGPSANPRSIPPLPTTTHRRQSYLPLNSDKETGMRSRTSFSLCCRLWNPNGGGYSNICCVKLLFFCKKGSATGTELEYILSIFFLVKDGLHSWANTLLTNEWTR